eukprot:6449047-Amphidinium_carterae.1
MTDQGVPNGSELRSGQSSPLQSDLTLFLELRESVLIDNASMRRPWDLVLARARSSSVSHFAKPRIQPSIYASSACRGLGSD